MKTLVPLLVCIALTLVGSPTILAQNTLLDSLKAEMEAYTQEDIQRAELLLAYAYQAYFYNTEESIAAAQKAVQLSQKLNYKEGEAQGYIYLALNADAGRNDPKTCIHELAKAIPLFQEAEAWDRLIYAWHVKAMCLDSQDNYAESLKAEMNALELAEQSNSKDSATIGKVYNMIATQYYNLNKFKESVPYFRKAIAIKKRHASKRSLALSYNALANTLGNHVQRDSVTYYYQKAHDLFEEINDVSGQAISINNIGNYYIEEQEYERAIPYLQRALEICQAEGLPFLESAVQYNLALIAQKQQRWEEALQRGKSSLKLAQKLEALNRIKAASKVLADTYEGMGKYPEALHYQQQVTLFVDSIFKVESAQQVAEMEAKLKLKEQETILLEQDLELERSRRSEQRLWGLLAASLLLGGIVFLLIRNRQRWQQRETHRLRELDQLKSRFFANISHEFRTPLTLILGPLNQFISGTFSGDPHTYFQMMKRNGERLLQLINQLLDLSKLEAGKLTLALQPLDLTRFLQVIAGQFDSLAASKNIQFHTEFPRHTLITLFDKDKLEKVLTNLLANAFKFTPEEGEVWLSLNQSSPEKLFITVRDNGIGIPEDQLAHIFDRFYQVEGNPYEGTGIGLALVKELVELHNGTITVHSHPGEGSTFLIHLPIELAEAEDTIPLSNSDISLTPYLPTPASSMDVSSADHSEAPVLLVVEDHPEVRSYIRLIMSGAYQVLEAKDGQEGLQIAQRELPDMIISDVMMPNLDGNAFTTAIKTDERTSHIPVILLTAKGGKDSKLEGLETGADDYLTKPFDEAELKVRVANLVEQRRRLRAKLGEQVIKLEPQNIQINSADERFLRRVMGIIETYMADEVFSIEDLGKEVGMSRSQLHRKLKALTDQSPSVFLRTLRLKRAHQLLQQRVGTAAEISYQVGFSSPAYFSKCFKDQFGMTPGEIMAKEVA